MTDIEIIINALNVYIVKEGRASIAPPEANKHLERIGLLNDSKDRPGKPLRDLLRKDLLTHAYLSGGKWVIPHSQDIGDISNARAREKPKVVKPKRIYSPATTNFDVNSLTEVLMNQKNYRSASAIDNFVPHLPGLYCIRIANPALLPAPYASTLAHRGHNIVYIGIATQSLKVRFLGQELRAKGHGTFFRSIGAMLSYQPLKGSLKNKTNKRNYTLPPDKEDAIIRWINTNLIVNWIEHSDDLERIEISLITKHLPLLNIKHNPAPLAILIKARAECITIACE